MRTLSEQEIRFVQAMRDAVALRGEGFRYHSSYNQAPDKGVLLAAYPDCRYTIKGESACMVGVAIEKFRGHPWAGENGPASVVLYDATDRGFHPESIIPQAANAAQRMQDSNSTWGEALREFERIITNAGYKLPE